VRILQVAHRFLPDSSGGTEVHTFLLSKALQRKGHQVAVYYRIADRRRPEHELISQEYQGIPVYKIVNNFTWSQGPDFDFFDPGQEEKFLAVLKSFQPDIVHFQHLGGGLSTSLPALTEQEGIPIMLTLHDFWPMCYRSHLLTSQGDLCRGPEGGLRCVQCWLYGAVERRVSIPRRIRELGLRNALRVAPRFLLDFLGLREYLPPVAYHTTRLMARDVYFRKVLQQFELLIAPSQFLRRRYIEWGVDPIKIRFIRNGVDPTKFAGLSKTLPLGRVLQAVYIGSILQHKGLTVLIEAFNQLCEVPVALRIYGNTKSSLEVQKYVRYLRGLNRNPLVTFEGPFPNEEIGRVLSEADFVIVPSILYENCPMVILEALYAGRPVLTSDVGGMAELIQDGRNGFTFRVGDAAHLAERVRFLCEHREILSQLQAQIEPPSTMEEVAEEVLASYSDLVDAHQTGEAG